MFKCPIIMFFIFPILMFFRMLKASRSDSLVFFFKGLSKSKFKEGAFGSRFDAVGEGFLGGLTPDLAEITASFSEINLGFLPTLSGF